MGGRGAKFYLSNLLGIPKNKKKAIESYKKK